MSTASRQQTKTSRKRLVVILIIAGLLVGGLIAFVTPAIIATRNSIGINLEGFRNEGGYRGRSGNTLNVNAGSATEYTLRGDVIRTSKAIAVTVNNIPAKISGDTFEITIPLEDGINSIDVRAESDNKEAVRTVTVTTDIE